MSDFFVGVFVGPNQGFLSGPTFLSIFLSEMVDFFVGDFCRRVANFLSELFVGDFCRGFATVLLEFFVGDFCRKMIEFLSEFCQRFLVGECSNVCCILVGECSNLCWVVLVPLRVRLKGLWAKPLLSGQLCGLLILGGAKPVVIVVPVIVVIEVVVVIVVVAVQDHFTA